ncbi:Periplasmic serine endoprotease DegP precursor [Anatilimnocola aggregata]|uniref:Periplasmic serine endoprotease DegP n=1 Tax=Anatilimnocola aggregata TaxID=2528021 RepID=A0A517YCW6_9BACT|nr:trypsin-like peptidase domain-containing protein [Anatilimnocola aggregata]QDU28083.1 Periplasmic serine endoprotease DegP precursor [Anatilimnocola aggregata]
MSIARIAPIFSYLSCLTLLVQLALPVIAQDVPAPVLSAERQRIEAIAKASKSAVAVFANGGNGGGSGVVISPDGYALTNFHVVQPAGSYMKCSMNDGRLYDAVIVGIDPTGDVAVIKLLGRDDFPTAKMVDSDQVKVGDWCFAVGNPFLLATDFQPTVTHGIVSGTHRYQYPAGTLLEYADCIQTDAAINPGNSGGPLYDANGDLIGVNGRGSFEKRGRVNVGVGYAISINQIKHFLGCLKSGRFVDHATAGFSVGTSEDGRVLVSNILENSDAYRRGLRYDAEVVAFGGRTIGTTNAFKNVLGIYPKGWRVPLTYRYDGKTVDTHVRLTGVHAEEELLELVQRKPKAAAPKPGEKDPKMPGDKKPTPEQPKPKVPGAAEKPKEEPPPPEVAKLIQPRRGYANYYFNLQNRERVWKAASAGADFSAQTGEWKLKGTHSRGDAAIEITLSSDKVEGVFPAEKATLDLSKDLDTQLAPSGSGGLLVALHLWRQLLVEGPEKFGDVYYYGTGPQRGIDGLADVFIATRNVVEMRLAFDPATGRLALLEMVSDADEDPCEVQFSDYREVNGRQFPHSLEVRRGEFVFGKLTLNDVQLTAGDAGANK